MSSSNRIIEGDIESYLVKRVEAAGGECIKMDTRRGIPDRLIVLPHGIVWWVETKRPKGGVIAPAQLVWHEKLRRLGQNVCVLKNKAEIDDWCFKVLNSGSKKDP